MADPLTKVSDEIQSLQEAVGILDADLQKIADLLIPLREKSIEMISGVHVVLSGIFAQISEQTDALHKVAYEIDQAIGLLRELSIRGKGLGVQEPVAKQKAMLADLNHICQDLLSDAEGIKHLELNLKARLERLRKGGV